MHAVGVVDERTFCEFAAVELSGLELYCDDMSEGLVEELDGYAET